MGNATTQSTSPGAQSGSNICPGVYPPLGAAANTNTPYPIMEMIEKKRRETSLGSY